MQKGGHFDIFECARIIFCFCDGCFVTISNLQKHFLGKNVSVARTYRTYGYAHEHGAGPLGSP